MKQEATEQEENVWDETDEESLLRDNTKARRNRRKSKCQKDNDEGEGKWNVFWLKMKTFSNNCIVKCMKYHVWWNVTKMLRLLHRNRLSVRHMVYYFGIHTTWSSRKVCKDLQKFLLCNYHWKILVLFIQIVSTLLMVLLCKLKCVNLFLKIFSNYFLFCLCFQYFLNGLMVLKYNISYLFVNMIHVICSCVQ